MNLRNPSFSPPILELGDSFYDPVSPAQFPKAILRYRNQKAANTIGLENLTEAEWLSHFGRFHPLPQNLRTPLALRYHGHQFTHYNPDLGDGRGFLFSQHVAEGKLYDLGTKGSGQTPYSRQGDGRLTLKGAVREALATTYLESKGVHTSKTFSVIETGESLYRNDEPSPTRSAVLVRLSHSHIRFGTFQRLAYIQEPKLIQKLTEYTIQHYYPELLSSPNMVEDFFIAVISAHARTTAQWMMTGFVHGVLNTDNMNITGETFDFGPYRFLPTYDIHFTAAYFDNQGLYCFGRQPITILWNLEQLSTALKVGYTHAQYSNHLQTFSERFHQACLEEFAKRLGISIEQSQNILPLFFRFLERSQIPFEQAFFDLRGGYHENLETKSVVKNYYQGSEWQDLKTAFLADKLTTNRTDIGEKCQSLLYPEIEEIWKKIDSEDDWSLFHQKIRDLSITGVQHIP